MSTELIEKIDSVLSNIDISGSGDPLGQQLSHTDPHS